MSIRISITSKLDGIRSWPLEALTTCPGSRTAGGDLVPACQGFPEDYEHVDVGLGKPLTKAEQTRMVGNSVPPGMAAAWVRANVPLWALGNRNAAMAA